MERRERKHLYNAHVAVLYECKLLDVADLLDTTPALEEEAAWIRERAKFYSDIADQELVKAGWIEDTRSSS